MLPLKGAEIADYTLASHSPTVQAELAALAQLAFSFEMDGFRGAPNNRPHNTHRSRSVSLSPTQDTNTNTRHGQQDATQLAQLAAASGISPHLIFPSHSYSAMMSSESDPLAGHLNFNDTGFAHGHMSHTQLPHISSTDLSWFQQALDQSHHAHSPTFSSPGAASSTSSMDFDNQTETDDTSMTEEKRRRNTAASARFRIKKKQRTVNLQRSISDLTGRADDLEREAADLRRENGWLKEIVMLKNSRFPPVDHMSNSGQRSEAGPSSNQSRPRKADRGSVSDSASSDEEQTEAGKGRKGKTKRRGNDSKMAKD